MAEEGDIGRTELGSWYVFLSTTIGDDGLTRVRKEIIIEVCEPWHQEAASIHLKRP